MEIIPLLVFIGVIVFIGYLKLRRINKGKDCCK